MELKSGGEEINKQKTELRNMGGFGIFLIVCSIITGGGAVYSFITGAEQNFFSFNASLTAGIFLAILGFGFIIVVQLQEIKETIEEKKFNNRKRNDTDEEVWGDDSLIKELENEKKAPKWLSIFAKIVLILAIIIFVYIIFR